VLRSTLPPEQMTNTLRSTVASMDPLLALQQMQTMDEALSATEAPRRFNTSIITAFAMGALLLATIGVYAVIGQSSGRPALGVAQARHCFHPEQSGRTCSLSSRPRHHVRDPGKRSRNMRQRRNCRDSQSP